MADKKCTIAWLKAHIGTKGNKAADKAARQGAENKNKTLRIINTPIPAEHAKSIIDEAIRKEWKRKSITSTQNYFMVFQTKQSLISL